MDLFCARCGGSFGALENPSTASNGDADWTPTVAGYSNLKRIGRGGSSSVYRARQDAFGRDVAIKILFADLSDKDDERRFHNECLVLGKLGSHPNIVDVYDAGITSEHRPYIVMNYYPRGNLTDRIRDQGSIPVPEAIKIINAIAPALEYAHSHGVIHRDIKPDNILIDHDGQPVLTDFGVAAMADAAGNYTTSIAFSPDHVAPEVLEDNEYGVASDIYSLASTLYTLLTGTAAFQATTQARRIIAITTQAPPPIEIPGVSADLESAILRAMAKTPADRPATPTAFARSLTDNDGSRASFAGLE